ncbi:MAG: TlpA family protein disulfide reductase [Muribaculaceae bacterium]
MRTFTMISMIAACVMFIGSCTSQQKGGNEEVNDGFVVNVGDQAPDFMVTTIDGQKIELSQLRGKVVMLQFTASWCRVCREEMPFIESDIWQRHKDNPDFMLLALDREEPAERVVQFVENIGITYPIAPDLDMSVFSKYAKPEAGVTRNVLIDRDGKIIYLTRLYEEPKFKKFVAFIDSVLQAK